MCTDEPIGDIWRRSRTRATRASTPAEVLRAATASPAEFLGLADSLGTVEPGKIADLVLLDANPLADIRNSRRVAVVIREGSVAARL